MHPLTDEAITQLLENLMQGYGYDFRQYSYSHVRRRITRWITKHSLEVCENLPELVLVNEEIACSLIHGFSVSVTTMFRDPHFYKAIREKVVPFLRTYPFIRIWHAGCATGEEVYSMAIVLTEENLYDKCRIYATDFNEEVLEQAREGIYPGGQVGEFSQNYTNAGGRGLLNDHFVSMYGSVIMNQRLKKNIVWANHNLVTDHVFNEMNMIICRNVLIYFTKPLQERALQLFHNSLPINGLLCLGTRETIQFTSLAAQYRELDSSVSVFQKNVL